MTKFPLLAVMLLITASAFAQTQTEKEIKELLCHKWKLTHMEQDGKKMEVPAAFGESFLDFRADGTILMIDAEKEEKNKWSYDHKTKTITTQSEAEVQKFEIIKISATELVLNGILEDMKMGMYMKRVN
jgi:hypothetical protein